MDLNKFCGFCIGCFYYSHTIQRCTRRQYLCTIHFPYPKGRINLKKCKYKSIWQ